MQCEKELHKIYKDLEKELSATAPPCRACGECCHFDEYDHTLYVNDVEVSYILNNIGLPKTVVKKGVCPYLFNNKCTIREHRPLGCRIFYCQEDWKTKSSEIYEKYHRKIKDLCVANGTEWNYSPLPLSLLSNNPKWRPCIA
ncbi:MAG: YkgJ family cysteine cluster protein [Candidatus Brocadiales bacterium]